MADFPTLLKQDALCLRNANPEVFDHFLNHLVSYVAELTVAVTDASPDNILVMQGRAQQARKFQLIFVEGGYPPQPKQPKPP